VAAGVDAAEAEARWPEVAASMLRCAAAQKSSAALGLELLPGVAELLAALKARGAVVALVTGNLEEIAWHKMDALNITCSFTEPRFGG
jgi:phosphoglycolate phosphatase-like HAD superfamily hydrolase